jgi:Bcr/CflA subfamily drug resistance transporter
LGYFATDIYLPSLPAIAANFHVGEAEIQMTMFVYLLSFAFTPLVFGPLSDHYGRRTITRIGLVITLLSTTACYFAQGINSFLLFRFVQGIGAGAAVIASRSMIPDLYKGRDLIRQYSYMTTGMPLILSLAPLIGGYLQEYFGWRSVFVFLTLYVASILAVSLNSEESLKTPRKRTLAESLQIYKDLLLNPAFMLFGLGMCIPAVGLFGYLTASPFLFQKLIGLSPSEFGFLAIYIGTTIMVASSINTQLLKYISVARLIRLGFTLIILAGISLFIVHVTNSLNKWTLLVPILVFFCCMPFSLANSASKSMTQIKEHFGSAGAILATMQFLFGSLGSLIFSVIPETNVLPLAICLITMGCLVQGTFTLGSRFESKEDS